MKRLPLAIICLIGLQGCVAYPAQYANETCFIDNLGRTVCPEQAPPRSVYATPPSYVYTYVTPGPAPFIWFGNTHHNDHHHDNYNHYKGGGYHKPYMRGGGYHKPYMRGKGHPQKK